MYVFPLVWKTKFYTHISFVYVISRFLDVRREDKAFRTELVAAAPSDVIFSLFLHGFKFLFVTVFPKYFNTPVV
jgi:hypothetical protein